MHGAGGHTKETLKRTALEATLRKHTDASPFTKPNQAQRQPSQPRSAQLSLTHLHLRLLLGPEDKHKRTCISEIKPGRFQEWQAALSPPMAAGTGRGKLRRVASAMC